MDVSNYKRVARRIVTAFGILIESVYVCVVNNFDKMPAWLKFICPTVKGGTPIFLQFILLDFIFYIIFISNNRQEGKYSFALSIISALMLFRFAVHAGWVVSEAVIISSLLTAACEIWGIRVGMLRVICLFLTWILGIWGLAVGAALVIIREVCVIIKEKK